MPKGVEHLPESQKQKISESIKRWHAERRARGIKGSFSGELTPENEKAMRDGQKEWRKTQVGENHPLWKGDAATYSTKHLWARRHIPLTGTCSRCGEERHTERANIDHRYRRVPEDWLELCKPCHYKLDQEIRANNS